jgi:hypothetical protein
MNIFYFSLLNVGGTSSPKLGQITAMSNNAANPLIFSGQPTGHRKVPGTSPHHPHSGDNGLALMG